MDVNRKLFGSDKQFSDKILLKDLQNAAPVPCYKSTDKQNKSWINIESHSLKAITKLVSYLRAAPFLEGRKARFLHATQVEKMQREAFVPF